MHDFPPRFWSRPHLLLVSQAQGLGLGVQLGDLLQGLESLLPWGQELARLWWLWAAPQEGDAQGPGAVWQLGLVLPLGLLLALSSELLEPGLQLEVWFCPSSLQSLGAGEEEDVFGSLLWFGVPALNQRSLLQIQDLDSEAEVPALDQVSPLWTDRLGSGTAVLEGGNRSLSQNRGWGIFIGFGWHLSPPCKPICLRRRQLPGIATRDLHIQQHAPTPSYGTAAHGPTRPTIPLGLTQHWDGQGQVTFLQGHGSRGGSTNAALAKGFPTRHCHLPRHPLPFQVFLYAPH